MSLKVRTASPGDARDARRLLRELGHTEDGLMHLEARLEALARDSQAVILVAEAHGRVVGLASGSATLLLEYPAPQLRLHALVVDPDQRRRGVARALVVEVEARARNLGCFRVELTSAHTLTAAHAFWQAAGYVETGRRFVRLLDPGKP